MTGKKPIKIVVCKHWRYEYYLPSEPLKTNVTCYWRITSRGKFTSLHKTRFMPDGRMDLIFDINSSKLQNRILLRGVMQKSFFMAREGKTELLGVKFQPGGFYSLFKLSAHYFTGTLSPFNIADANIARLFEQVFLGKNNQTRLRILEAALSRLVGNSKPVLEKVRLALEAINNSKGEIRVCELSKMLKISENQLKLQFEKCIGTNTKSFSGVVRFLKAYGEVHNLFEKRMLDVALDNGYYDQPHFVREFKKLYGLTPSQVHMRDWLQFLRTKMSHKSAH